MTDKPSKDWLISIYDRNLEEYGYDPRALAWHGGRQKKRFNALTEIGDLDNCSVLDVGCGFGDLRQFLIDEGINIKYTGFDINKNIVNKGKEIYPGIDLRVVDIEESEDNTKYDWVISSGIFNRVHPNRDTKEYIMSMLSRMFELCNKGIAANFISTYVDYRINNWYTSPEWLFGFCKSLSERVVLRHDYMKFDFCVYIYKNVEDLE